MLLSTTLDPRWRARFKKFGSSSGIVSTSIAATQPTLRVIEGGVRECLNVAVAALPLGFSFNDGNRGISTPKPLGGTSDRLGSILWFYRGPASGRNRRMAVAAGHSGERLL